MDSPFGIPAKRRFPSAPKPAATGLLDAFRKLTDPEAGEVFRPPVPRREKVITACLVLLIFLSPWGLGGNRLWAQWVLLVPAAAAFLFLFLPVGGTFTNYEDTAHEILQRLLRFPVFWLGAAFLLYITIQGLNPELAITLYAPVPYLVHIEPFIPWLPTGVRAPFADMNAFRMVLVYGIVLLAVCAAWAGLKRRRSWLALYWGIAATGVCVALVGLVQKVSGTHRILWLWENTWNAQFFGPFVYRNHASTFLYLACGLTLALAFHFWVSSHRRLAKSGPHVLLLLPAALIALSVPYTLSARGLLCLLIILGLALVLFVFGLVRLRSGGGSLAGTTILAGLLGLLAVTLVSWQDFSAFRSNLLEANKRFQENADSLRPALREATLQMIRESRVWGWGAGSYGHVSPEYFRGFSEFYQRERIGVAWRSDFAHCDPLQYVCDYGIGAVFPALMLAWVAWQALRRSRVLPTLSLFTLLCLLVALGNSWYDFLFFTPPLLLLTGLSAVAAVRFAQLDDSTRF